MLWTRSRILREAVDLRTCVTGSFRLQSTLARSCQPYFWTGLNSRQVQSPGKALPHPKTV